jgi:eukaryotic-like serine/threonine-protein kinase
VVCSRCDAEVPGTARFCPSCGLATDGAATVGATGNATRLPPTLPFNTSRRRTPTPVGAAKPSSPWMADSDAISHGRFVPGTVFDGRYRIVGLLGKGGMGEVFRADDLRLGQPVALKLLPGDLQTDPVRLAQFHNEVRVARQVSHPNVCRVHDIGEADGLLYLSMEYVDGEDLSSSLRRIGRFPEDKATEISRQLCAGIAAAHQKGVVHRDLKPANVMLDAQGRVRIMDFGLAAVGHVEDVRAGTPAYMAPEQLLGREVGPASDIFALGLIMYELYTGKRAFSAKTIGELVNQHESRALTPPSTLVLTMDVAVERAILRCLDPEPHNRPQSALSVSAALPGGDPLAAALAAGETPSPEMVAAAGQGAGLRRSIAVALLLGIAVGLASTFALALRTSPFDLIRPELPPEVLAQKAREALAQLGYDQRPRDEAYGFDWDGEFVNSVKANDKPAPQWKSVLTQRPSPFTFWYRRSNDTLIAYAFHSDLLTPGIVDRGDPPPVQSGMINAQLDHQGRLLFFEAIPPQRSQTPAQPARIDWTPLFRLAGLDQSLLNPATPEWNWLAASDTRAAWTGIWPESGRPLRVEAASLGGRLVAFQAIGPWRSPWRMSDPADSSTSVYLVVLLALALLLLGGSAFLALRNIRDGRGDRRGAIRLASIMTVIMLALWACTVHAVADVVLVATFLVAVATAIFYGVLIWTMYLALEPLVRRHWPQVLVSWTNVLTGGAGDPVVARDVLIGVGLGVWFAVLFRLLALLFTSESVVSYIGDIGGANVFLGLRSTLGGALGEAPYTIRNVLLYFFVLFVMRVAVRRGWLAGVAFTVSMAGLNAMSTPHGVNAIIGLLYYGSGAFVIVRWGLLPFAIGTFVNSLIFDIAATRDLSAWYFGDNLVLIGIVASLAAWGFWKAVPRELASRGVGL